MEDCVSFFLPTVSSGQQADKSIAQRTPLVDHCPWSQSRQSTTNILVEEQEVNKHTTNIFWSSSVCFFVSCCSEGPRFEGGPKCSVVVGERGKFKDVLYTLLYNVQCNPVMCCICTVHARVFSDLVISLLSALCSGLACVSFRWGCGCGCRIQGDWLVQLTDSGSGLR